MKDGKLKNIIEKIFYCECPECHERGIYALNKFTGKFSNKVYCKYCGKEFISNRFWQIVLMVIIFCVFVSVGFAAEKIFYVKISNLSRGWFAVLVIPLIYISMIIAGHFNTLDDTR